MASCFPSSICRWFWCWCLLLHSWLIDATLINLYKIPDVERPSNPLTWICLQLISFHYAYNNIWINNNRSSSWIGKIADLIFKPLTLSLVYIHGFTSLHQFTCITIRLVHVSFLIKVSLLYHLIYFRFVAICNCQWRSYGSVSDNWRKDFSEVDTRSLRKSLSFETSFKSFSRSVSVSFYLSTSNNGHCSSKQRYSPSLLKIRWAHLSGLALNKLIWLLYNSFHQLHHFELGCVERSTGEQFLFFLQECINFFWAIFSTIGRT